MQRAFDATSGVLLAVLAFPGTIAVAVASGLPIRAAFASAAVASVSFVAFGGRDPRFVAPSIVLVPLVAAIAHRHGLAGLVIATAFAGFLQVLAGVCNVGRAFAAAPGAVVRALYIAAAFITLRELATATSAPLSDWPVRPTGFLAVDLVALLPGAVAIALVSALATLRSSEPRASADCDADLVALGLANTACGLLGALPVALARTRSEICETQGVGTRTALIGHAVAAAALVFAVQVEPPRAVLVALVAVSAVHAVDVPWLIAKLRRSQFDRLAIATVLLVAASLGFTRAVFVAAAIALVAFARAHGRLVVTIQTGPVVVARLSGELFFGSRGELAPLHELETPAAMVLDVSQLSLIDASGVRALALLVESLRSRGCSVTVVAEGALGPLLDGVGKDSVAA